MDKVMDRVVETQLKIYNTICYRSFVFLVTGNLVYKCEFVCRDGSRFPAQVRGRVMKWWVKGMSELKTAKWHQLVLVLAPHNTQNS